jgi:hypothetical protein
MNEACRGEREERTQRFMGKIYLNNGASNGAQGDSNAQKLVLRFLSNFCGKIEMMSKVRFKTFRYNINDPIY